MYCEFKGISLAEFQSFRFYLSIKFCSIIWWFDVNP